MAGRTPWIADLHHEQRVGGRFYVNIIEPGNLVPVALVVTGVEGFGREEGWDRARLIAAAPELLGALATLLRELEWVNEQLDLMPDDYAEAHQNARAAIAKAGAA